MSDWFTPVVFVVVMFVLWQVICSLFYKDADGQTSNLIEVVKHNRELYRTGRADKSKKQYTSIRPDLGKDDTTSSGCVEKSRPVKK